MRVSRLVIALVLALLGLVWIGQGTGVIGGSVMTGSGFWGVVGAILVVVAVVLAGLEARRGSAR
jgi:hypothetical protein